MNRPHFNNLTPEEDERLSLLLEEMGEVIQIIGKITRHGYESRHPNGGPTNRELLETELGHVKFAMGLMYGNNDFSDENVIRSAKEKSRSVIPYLHHQDWIVGIE